MTFASPLALVGLAALPLVLAAYLVHHRRRRRYAQRFAAAAMLPNVVDRSPGWRRHVPFAILLVGLATMLVGMARPRAMLSVRRENATVVLAIDTSRSMSATDVRPSRLAAARASAERFLAELPEKYRVGVVAFSTKAEVVAPATRDRELVSQALAALRPGEGTALGDAVSLALDVGRSVPREAGSDGRPGDIPPVSVLLLSDGLQENGRTTPGQAILRARQLEIPISTVALGTPLGIVEVPRVGGFVQRIRVPAAPEELQKIARGTGGHFYTAAAAADLTDVYRDLGSRLGTTRKRREVTVAFAIGAGFFLLLGGGVSTLWLRRVP